MFAINQIAGQTTETQRLRPSLADSQVVPSVAASWWGRVAVACAFLVVIALATFNLQYYPRTWYDEGINLQAARALAESGRYGLEYSGQFHPFDRSMSTGPTVIAAVALTFKLFGVGLIQGRMVMVGYLVLATLGLYVLGRQLFDRLVAVVAVFVVASLGEVGLFANGRHVLGEVAALAFLYWGVAIFLKAWPSKSDVLFLAAGTLFGLAILTKIQFLLIAPVLLVLCAVGRLRGSTPSARQFILLFLGVAGPTGLWYAYQLIDLGMGGLLERIDWLRQGATTTSYTAPLSRSLGAVKLLITSGFAIWGLAGLLYVWLLPHRESSSLPARLVLQAFAVIWLAWFVFLSVGWARYAVPVAVTGSLFEAKLLCDLARKVSPIGRDRFTFVPRTYLADPLGTALLAALFAVVVGGILVNADTIARSRDASPQEFGNVIMQQVSPNAVVESSEWEIGFLAKRTYHVPPIPLLERANAIVTLHQSAESLESYRVPATVSYIVDGPYSKLTGIYRGQLATGEFVRVASVGEYDLYRRVSQR